MSSITIMMIAAAAQSPTTKPQPGPAPPPYLAIQAVARRLTPAYYPPGALRNLKQGYSVVEVSIDPQGKAYQCTIVFSSGTRELDDQACAIFVRMPRFQPATDDSGQPIAQIYRERFAWHLATMPNLPEGPTLANLTVDVKRIPNGSPEAITVIGRVEDIDGHEESCSVAGSSEIAALDALACGLAKGQRLTDTPALNSAGQPMRALRYYRIRFVSEAAPAPTGKR